MPKYPEKSLRKGEQGRVAVGYVIQSDGTTSSHRLVVTSGANFNSSAISAAKQFTYSPSDGSMERIRIHNQHLHFSNYQKPDGELAKDEGYRRKM